MYNTVAFKCDVASAGLERMNTVMQTNDVQLLNKVGINVHLKMAENYWNRYYEAFAQLGGYAASPEEQKLLEERYVATEYTYTTLLTILNTHKEKLEVECEDQERQCSDQQQPLTNPYELHQNLQQESTQERQCFEEQHVTTNVIQPQVVNGYDDKQGTNSCQVTTNSYEAYQNSQHNIPSTSYQPAKYYKTVTEPQLMVHEVDSLNIKPFDTDKDPAYWPVFKDAFVNFYHRRSDMNNISKMNRLIGHIVANTIAYDILCRYTCTEANYMLAWESLCDTFDNAGRIVDDIITKFLNQPVLDISTRIGILRISNSVTHLLQVLKTHGIKTESWDTIVIILALRRLDPDTRRAWRAAQDPKIIGSVPTFVKFLTRRAYTIDEERSLQSQSHKSSAAVSSSSSKQFVLKSSNGKKIICALCNEQHLIYKCPKFTGMNRDKRSEHAKKLQLCLRCLREKHKINNLCTFSMCPYCNGDHNGLLCPLGPTAATATVIKTNRS